MKRSGVSRRLVTLSAAIGLGVATLGVGAGAAMADPGHAHHDVGGTVLYVSTSGSDVSNSCNVQEAPCATIQHAVMDAEGLSGAVVIEVGAGTYPEQVTIVPPASSLMTSLTVMGQGDGDGSVVIQPTSLVQNLCEANTGYFFDDNSGSTAAIIGVQTGVGLTSGSCPVAGSGNGAAVTLENLTVDGSALGGLPPGGELEGIGFIDTSGAIRRDVVENIQQPSAAEQASVHGIEVKSTDVAESVSVAGNVIDNNFGHVGIDLMGGAPGSLSAQVSGNRIVGTPSTAVPTPPSSGQFGVAAGGLSSLSISGNLIRDMQSTFSVGGIWLDSQAPNASCTVQDNTLLANDNGIDVHGAQGCVIERNDITAGSAGIELGPIFSQSFNFSAASPDNTIEHNVIQGTTTVATTLVYGGGPAVAGVPVDGVLVWAGYGNTVDENSISGFVSDVYVGEDPVYLNNSASWPSGSPNYGDNSGNVVHANDIVDLATPASGSGVTGYGVANLNNAVSFTLDATGNWWGCRSGPNTDSCTTTGGSVTYAPWAHHPLEGLIQGRGH